MSTALSNAVDYYRNGQLPDAKAACLAHLEIMPNDAQALHILSLIHHGYGHYSDAIACVTQAIAIGPPAAAWYSNLGAFHRALGEFDLAASAMRRALELEPTSKDAWNNLGVILKSLGDLPAAITCLQNSIRLDNTDPIPHSNLLYTLTATQTLAQDKLADEYRNWDRQHGTRQRLPPPPNWNHDNIRIGYVSCDLHGHPVARFFKPLLRHHSTHVDVTVYAHVRRRDDITHRLQALATTWTEIQTLNDRDVAEQIRADEIDILVDLSGHTAHNRLGVFAHRPAPIQVTYLGYFGTTGMSTMDYWLTDRELHPPTTTEWHQEQLAILPRCWVAYEPPQSAPEPRLRLLGSTLTFGSFSDATKLNPAVVATWATILKRLPSSNLHLQAKQYDTPSIRERILHSFEEQQIDRQRILFSGHTSLSAYFEAYQNIDIVLDPFPRSGGTTIADAIWMGVPVVSLTGSTYAGRIAHSKLVAMDLDEWSTPTRSAYVEKAVELAQNPMLRAQLREQLRVRMLHSSLCDGPGLAAAIESLFRSLLQR